MSLTYYLTAQLTNKTPLNKTRLNLNQRGCRKNQNMPFSPLCSAKCHCCHSSLKSIFFSASSPTLSLSSGLCAPGLSDPPTQCSVLFFLPRSYSFFIIYGLFLFCYPGFGWRLDGRGWGDGPWLVCTFWSKLKYSCIRDCVSVWEQLHVYPFLVCFYIFASNHVCCMHCSGATDKMSACCMFIFEFFSFTVFLFFQVTRRRPVVWFSSQNKTQHINYPWIRCTCSYDWLRGGN